MTVLLVLLILCAYRGTRLITKDTFPPVLRARDRLAGGWRKLTEAEAEYMWEDPDVREIDGIRSRYIVRWKRSPYWLAELITCPWCASAYVSGALVLVTDLTVGVQWPWLMGGAVWAGSSLLASRSWS